jgi:glycosyltransferase involved in cell wall biosynthesis
MLTIIIPAYNHQKYVLESLAAARKVVVPGLKILVIDDGSTDETLSVVNESLLAHPADNVAVVSKPNGGLVSSLSMGLEMAETPYLYIVASDDILIPDGIERVMEVLEGDSNLKFCIGGALNYFENEPAKNSQVYGEAHERFFALEENSRAEALFMNYPQPILLQSTIFRVSALKEIGGWDKEILLDDYPTFIKLLSRFPVISKDYVFRPEILVSYYRQHDTNSYKNVERQFGIVKQMLMKLSPKSIYPKAIGKVLALHFLGAIRSGQVIKGFAILKGHCLKVYLSFIWFFSFFIFRFLSARFFK